MSYRAHNKLCLIASSNNVTAASIYPVFELVETLEKFTKFE